MVNLGIHQADISNRYNRPCASAVANLTGAGICVKDAVSVTTIKIETTTIDHLVATITVIKNIRSAACMPLISAHIANDSTGLHVCGG